MPVPLQARHVACPLSKREAAPYKSSFTRPPKPPDEACIEKPLVACLSLQLFHSNALLHYAQRTSEPRAVGASCTFLVLIAVVRQPPEKPASRNSRLRLAAAHTLLKGEAPAGYSWSPMGPGAGSSARGRACIVVRQALTSIRWAAVFAV